MKNNRTDKRDHKLQSRATAEPTPENKPLSRHEITTAIEDALPNTKRFLAMKMCFEAGRNEILDDPECGQGVWRRTFDILPAAVYVIEKSGKFVYANDEARELLGYPDLPTLLKANCAQLYQQAEDWRAILRELDRTGTMQRQVIWKTLDKKKIRLRNCMVTRYDADEDRIVYVGVLDVVDPAHPALATEFIRDIPMPCVELADDCTVHWASQAAQALLGYSICDLRGLRFFELFRNRDWHRVEKRMNAFAQGEFQDTDGHPVTMSRRHSEYFPARMRLQRVRVGAEQRFLVYLENLSVRAELEKLLSVDLTTLCVNAALLDVPVFAKDLQHRFLLVNRAFAGEHGLAPDDMKNLTDADFYEDGLPEKYCADDDLVTARGICLETIEQHRVPGGASEFVHVLKFPLRGKERQIVGVVGVYWPETQRAPILTKVRETNPS